MPVHAEVYRFSPRPEAHATTWAEQLAPVRTAVHGLLVRLEGAETARSAAGTRSPSNCFLVYGPRGTGKTTVLLSARDAVTRPERGAGFFPAKEASLDELGQQAQACAEKLSSVHRVVWLDVLDLEPLPASANLLTALLTRVSDALGSRGERDRQRLPSIFEEGADDVRQQFEHLVNDATVMWEEIEESDTRNRANRQRAAASIYAGFRPRFVEAMNALATRLGHLRGHEEGSSIVLPIDNVDRSPEHLKAIVKLAQMVSHGRLWLVMAGDRAEVEAFLERAFWKELTRTQSAAEAHRTAEYGEDEAQGMARRQAHAASRKVWPPSHRVEVDLVGPQDVLSFRLPDDKRSVRDLLAAVPIETFMRQHGGRPARFGFIELFEPPVRHAPLSLAASKALSLPARAVLDLWQLAHYWLNDDPGRHVAAAMIAWTMLRGAVLAGSTLPGFVVEHLRRRTVQRGTGYRTLLDIAAVPLRVEGRLSVAATIPQPAVPLDAPGLLLRSSLRVRDERDMLLKVFLGSDPAIELDDLSAAWLLILYDVLLYVPELAVLGKATVSCPLVEVDHDAVIDAGGWRRGAVDAPPRPISWPAPEFASFGAYENFWRSWRAFRSGMQPGAPCPTCGCNPCPSELLAGWVGSALRAHEACLPSRDAARGPASTAADPVAALEAAAALYDVVESESRRPLPERQRMESAALCDWLQQGLPRLLTRAYVPLGGSPSCRARLFDWVREHHGTALVTQWRAMQRFLWADLDAELAARIAPGQSLAPAQQGALQHWAYGDLRMALG